jgi:hypothetical protein
MRISFDFDCTLGEDIIQKKASLLIASTEYCDVFIITSRNKDVSYNRDLLSVAKRLGIPEQNIHFTEGDWKWQTIKMLNIDIHYDDVPEECELIRLNTNCLSLLIWDEYRKESIKHESFGKGIY